MQLVVQFVITHTIRTIAHVHITTNLDTTAPLMTHSAAPAKSGRG